MTTLLTVFFPINNAALGLNVFQLISCNLFNCLYPFSMNSDVLCRKTVNLIGSPIIASYSQKEHGRASDAHKRIHVLA